MKIGIDKKTKIFFDTATKIVIKKSRKWEKESAIINLSCTIVYKFMWYFKL